MNGCGRGGWGSEGQRPRWRILTAALLVLCCLGEARAGEGLRGWDALCLPAPVALPRVLDFCGETAPLAQADVWERLEKECLVSLWNRDQTLLWMKRAGRYFPLIERSLRQNGMPDDLKYMAVIESSLRPHAGSSKGAMGYWQFMEKTAQRYGLEVGAAKDERRNIFTATGAAVRYLKDLYGLFGSWTLAAAAYNMGEEGLRTEILIQKTRDYYRLYLPPETQSYVFRILAAKWILSQPRAFGFALTPADLYPPLVFEEVEVRCPVDVPLSLVADAAGTSFKTVKDLNPELRGYYLAEGVHALRLPQGTAAGFAGRFEALIGSWRRERQENLYTVKPGDTLSAIAVRFQVPLPALLVWNRLQPKKTLVPGETLVVYREGASGPNPPSVPGAAGGAK